MVARPRTTLIGWIEADDRNLTRPIVFVALCVAIGFLLQIPRLTGAPSAATMIGAMATFKIVALVLVSALIQLLFKAFGGRGTFLETVYLYVAGPVYLVLVLVFLLTAGLGQGPHAEFANRVAGILQLVIILAWFTTCWGAFRSVHRVSRLRSAVVGAIMLVCLPVIAIGFDLITRGMFAKSPALQ